MTYGPETGIPGNAELEVNEILPNDPNSTDTSFVYGISYEEYVEYTENVLGMEEGSAGYIRLFDIKIVDKNDSSVKYQPKDGTSVDVRIELADSMCNELSVVHFENEDDHGFVIDCETDGYTVEFAVSGFSVYAIINHEGGELVTPRVVVHYIHYDFTENAEGVFSAGPYNSNFPHKKSTTAL